MYKRAATGVASFDHLSVRFGPKLPKHVDHSVDTNVRFGQVRFQKLDPYSFGGLYLHHARHAQAQTL